jgi:BatD DUF11 like domain
MVREIFLTTAIALAVGTSSVLGASPSVTAVLSNSDVAVGQTVQLEIRVTDAGDAAPPAEIPVDGLEIHQTGTSREIELHNFSTTSSVTYNYTVLPLKPGTFKIPAQTIRADNTTLRTPELTLQVSALPGRQGAPHTAGGLNANTNANAKGLAFAEIIVPKKTAFVGEIVPMVVRVAFATRGQPTEPPEITGQGFTVLKVQSPDEPQVETMNGRQWEVFTFKTAIAAARPGKLDIGPAKTEAVVIMPRRFGSLFGTNDPFSDPFFRDAFGAFGQQQNITIKSNPVDLDVKPLPANAPPHFSGAVGTFTLSAEAKPKTVQVGDPITFTAMISGRGNFDRVNAPVLQDQQGWHTYPPSAKFKPNDDVGLSGDKTFEIVLSPNEKKEAIPPFLFTYFDPVKERYVTLHSDSIPIQVEGASIAAASVAPAPAAAESPEPSAPAKPSPKPGDILYQLTERPWEPQSFTPLYLQRNFWLVQLVPLVGLIGLIGWNIRQTRLHNLEARRKTALQHEISELSRKLRRRDATPEEYFSDASRLIQLKTALTRKIDPNLVDMETAALAFQMDESEREQLRRLFERSDELRYSGGAANGSETVSPETRRETLSLIEHLRT